MSVAAGRLFAPLFIHQIIYSDFAETVSWDESTKSDVITRFFFFFSASFSFIHCAYVCVCVCVCLLILSVLQRFSSCHESWCHMRESVFVCRWPLFDTERVHCNWKWIRERAFASSVRYIVQIVSAEVKRACNTQREDCPTSHNKGVYKGTEQGDRGEERRDRASGR